MRGPCLPNSSPSRAGSAVARSASVAMPISCSRRSVTWPTPHMRETGRDARKATTSVVDATEVVAFLASLPVSRMWGVGQVTERRLQEMGIATLADLATADPARLGELFGKHG